MKQTTTNSRTIHADIETVYNAFRDRNALEYWLAPIGMTGQVHHFDFKVDGTYEMSLFYNDNVTTGKTSGNEDRFSATFREIIPYKKIVQAINFQSDNKDLNEEMIMEVSFEPIDKSSTNVTISFQNIPESIDPKDNEDGTEQSLEKLARYTEKK